MKSLEGKIAKTVLQFYVLEYRTLSAGEAKFENGQFKGLGFRV